MQNEERIIGLETQVRTLKRIVYGFGCLLVAGVVVSATSMQTVPDVIQAKKFEVVNDEGKKVAALAASKYGGAMFLWDKEGKPFVGLNANANGGMLHISNNEGKTIASIWTGEDGNGGLKINDKDENSIGGIAKLSKGGILFVVRTDGSVVTFP